MHITPRIGGNQREIPDFQQIPAAHKPYANPATSACSGINRHGHAGRHFGPTRNLQNGRTKWAEVKTGTCSGTLETGAVPPDGGPQGRISYRLVFQKSGILGLRMAGAPSAAFGLAKTPGTPLPAHNPGYSSLTRVAWSRCCVTMCLKRRLARHCNMVTQQRDHATRQAKPPDQSAPAAGLDEARLRPTAMEVAATISTSAAVTAR